MSTGEQPTTTEQVAEQPKVFKWRPKTQSMVATERLGVMDAKLASLSLALQAGGTEEVQANLQKRIAEWEKRKADLLQAIAAHNAAQEDEKKKISIPDKYRADSE